MRDGERFTSDIKLYLVFGFKIELSSFDLSHPLLTMRIRSATSFKISGTMTTWSDAILLNETE